MKFSRLGASPGARALRRGAHPATVRATMRAWQPALVLLVAARIRAVEALGSCDPSGDCVRCAAHEMSAAFCAETGRKQEWRCTHAAASDAQSSLDALAIPSVETGAAGPPPQAVHMREDFEFRSCERTKSEELHMCIALEVVCVLAGLSALVGVSRRKRMSLSIFDQLRQQRGIGLPGDSPRGETREVDASPVNGSPPPTTRRLRGAGTSAANLTL